MSDPYAKNGPTGSSGLSDDASEVVDPRSKSATVGDSLDQSRAEALRGAGRIDEARAVDPDIDTARTDTASTDTAYDTVPGDRVGTDAGRTDRHDDRFDDRSPGRRAYTSDTRAPGDQRSIGDIMGDLSRDVSTLMRQEVALAKAEVAESGKRAGKGVGMLGGAGVAAIFVLSFLSLAAWWAIGVALSGPGEAPSLALSGLIVAGIWAIIAAILAAVGKSQLNKITGMQQTTETAKQIPNALKGNEEENR